MEDAFFHFLFPISNFPYKKHSDISNFGTKDAASYHSAIPNIQYIYIYITRPLNTHQCFYKTYNANNFDKLQFLSKKIDNDMHTFHSNC